MPFIEEGDRPLLLKGLVNGKPGFRLHPQGEEGDEIFFPSKAVLVAWAEEVLAQAKLAEYAQPYEEWLEMYS